MFTPSRLTFCDCDRAPLKLSPTTPAWSAIKAPASRFCNGNEVTRIAFTTLLTEVLRVSTGPLPATTVTLSVTAPTSSVRSTPTRALTARSTLSAIALRNPGASAVTRYSPGWRDGNRYTPASLLDVFIATPVLMLVAVTAALVTAPPERSASDP